MSILPNLNCLLGRHEPQRREVEWNGSTYVGHCKHCGKPIQRIKHRSWRERPV
ncbi:MAG: hypothetical protein AAF697_03770 [Pseudomonadota bacterium]